MELQNYIPWEAIAAQLKGVASADEIKQIQEWLDASPDHPVILHEIASTWSVTKNRPDFYIPDMGYNWNKLMLRINERSKPIIRYAMILRWFAAAAVLILVFLAGITYQDLKHPKLGTVAFSRVVAPKGSKTTIILPDSSKVWLNSGAELWYPSDFTSDHRMVWMKGECFFQVKKDPDHPFLVHGTKLQVKVYGTSFNIREDDARELTDVALVNGKVKVLDLNDETISNLNSGQQFLFQKGIGKVRVAENMDALTSWVNNILIFKNQPFEEVIHYLNSWYGVNIELDHTLYYRHNYTFKVKTESLREVLELITIITPIDYQIEGDQIKIKYRPKM